MNCNCISEMEAKIREHFQPQVKATIQRVECGNTAFVLSGNSMDLSLYIPFRIRADAPGYRTKSGKEIPMHVSFCPFCGNRARPETNGG